MAKRNLPQDGGRFKRVRKADEAKIHGNPVGRPTDLTPDLAKRICDLIRGGNYIETACRCVGICNATLYHWLKRGGKGEEPFAKFVSEVEKAVAQAEANDVLNIGRASATQWQAAAWRLERKQPKKWGRRDHIEIAGDPDKPLNVNVIEWGSRGEKLEF